MDRSRLRRAQGAALVNLLLLPGLAGILLVYAAPARAAEADADRAIVADELRAHVELLADDRLKGREYGTDGGREAAEYAARCFREAGVAPGGTDGTYFQPFRAGGRDARNVVAAIEGADAAGRDYVVVGAHYDHVGLGGSGALDFISGRGKVHNGADDNASGTAAVLGVAKAFAALGRKPARTVYFVLFDAEEQGLLGSLHFVAHPPGPIERCSGMVNMDMVGRAVKGRVHVYGAGSGSGLEDVVRAENEALGLTLAFERFMTPNSDHFAFYRAKVATVHLFTGIHRDYHRAGDDAHKINYPDLERVARLAFRITLALADADAPPVFAEVPLPPPAEMIAMILESFVGPGVAERVRKLLFGDEDRDRPSDRDRPRDPERRKPARRLF